MSETPKILDMVVTDDIASVAPPVPEIDAPVEQSVVRRYLKANRRRHAATPEELLAYSEGKFIDMVEDTNASPEQQFAALRELVKLPRVNPKLVGMGTVWQPSPDTEDVLDRL